MIIKGLSRYHKCMLRRFLKQHTYSFDSEIVLDFETSFSLKRLNSLWYGGGMVNVKYKGYIFHIEACGDIYADLRLARSLMHIDCIKDRCNLGGFYGVIRDYFRSDKTLEKALAGEHPKYFVKIQHGNWWECSVTDPNGNWHDLSWASDKDSLLSVIDEVLSTLDETINQFIEGAA